MCAEKVGEMSVGGIVRGKMAGGNVQGMKRLTPKCSTQNCIHHEIWEKLQQHVKKKENNLKSNIKLLCCYL